MMYKNIIKKMETKIQKQSHHKKSIKHNSLPQYKTQFIIPINCSQKIFLFLKLIIIFQIITNIISKENQISKLYSHYSYITLNINQKGNRTFLSSNFNKCPNEVYINGNKTSEGICKSILLNDTNNQIKLVWQKEINNTDYMFYRLYNIKIIDLSHFNSSLVKSMNYMFSYCYNLTSIDFSNINTSLVTSMQFMFQGCQSLSSLNLIGFNTSKVTSMKSMFSSCIKIKSLDLSFLDTSSVNNMKICFIIALH